MILMIDNYDSFTYNLVQYLGILGAEVLVVRNDAISVDEVEGLHPQAIVISPGPCTPDQAGISVEVVKQYSGHIPILGVCLGHQSIVQAFGGKVVRAQRIMHGKTSPIEHNGSGVFDALPTPFEATRYHSLVAEEDSFPELLQITARSTDDNEIMALVHGEHITHGIQFHPESILTCHGMDLLKNFLILGGVSCR
jgi:anthranilate synthase/aminodeoxychorismate synthase-like glutamine amidotransferase